MMWLLISILVVQISILILLVKISRGYYLMSVKWKVALFWT